MAGKEKLIRGALGALTDIFKKGSDEPADPSRRAFLKGAPGAAVGGAGALAGIGGTAAIVGAKALFGQGRFDKIISEVKPAIDEFYESGGDWKILEDALDLTPQELDSVLKKDTFAGEYLDDAIARQVDHTNPATGEVSETTTVVPPRSWKAGYNEVYEKGFDVPGSKAERAFLREQWDSVFYNIEDFPSSMFHKDLGAPLFKHMAKKIEPDLVDDKELTALSDILF